jgi:hypothetical protein
MLSGLQNPVSAQPSYPPLVPASGALSFALFGHEDLRVVAEITALLNACGVVGTGIVAVAIAGALSRVTAVAAAAAVCLVAIAVTGPVFAVGGYADLLWSSCAVGAVIWGLVLPPCTQALGASWFCAAVAGLTKQEVLTTALVVPVLIALRYRPITPGVPGPHSFTPRKPPSRGSVNGGAPLARAGGLRGGTGAARAGLGHTRALVRLPQRGLLRVGAAIRRSPRRSSRQGHGWAASRGPRRAGGTWLRVPAGASGP